MAERENSVVIVALPAEDDPVHAVSSEKGAHMTVLFLGKDPDIDIDRLKTVVADAAGRLGPVSAPVMARETLGDDKADVVMLEPGLLRDARDKMLEDDYLKSVYDSVKQYPKWTPHLTLGYPDTPAAKHDMRGRNINFDRLAVWDGDYEGEEYPLFDRKVLAAAVTAAVTPDERYTYMALLDERDVVMGLALFSRDYAFYREEGDWIVVTEDGDDPIDGMTSEMVDEDFVEIFDRAEDEQETVEYDDIAPMIAAMVERYVRTAEGAQMYGQPIGARIIVDEDKLVGDNTHVSTTTTDGRVYKPAPGTLAARTVARLDLTPDSAPKPLPPATPVQPSRPLLAPPPNKPAPSAALTSMSHDQLKVLLEAAPDSKLAADIGSELLRRLQTGQIKKYAATKRLREGWDEEGNGWASRRKGDAKMTVHQKPDGTWSWSATVDPGKDNKKSKTYNEKRGKWHKEGTAASQEDAVALAERHGEGELRRIAARKRMALKRQADMRKRVADKKRKVALKKRLAHKKTATKTAAQRKAEAAAKKAQAAYEKTNRYKNKRRESNWAYARKKAARAR